MDALRDAVNNITLYDVKAAVRKAQNVVMNYTEMESKVREATNNEPWGASSTLMNEIASGTFNYQLLNEIMPMIYKRFTEKSAEEWRQIYKALQLLEFLIKHGSEQVIDDARSHLSTIKMLRQFYYIDLNGKDQGINVRNRAKELAELLSDVDRIRMERKKARSTRNKYGGVEGGAGTFGGFSGGMSSGIGEGNGFGKKYGGFGSDQADFGGYSGGVYGDGGGFGGASRTGGFHDEGGSGSSSRRNRRFDDDDDYEEESVSRPAPRRYQRETTSAPPPPPAAKPPPPKKAPEVDLFSFDEPAAPAAPANGKGKQTSALDDFGTLQSGGADEDDFDDFQSATPASAAPPAQTSTPMSFNAMPPLTSSASQLSIAQPKPVSTNQQSDLNSLVGFTSPPPSSSSAFSPPPTGTSMMSPTMTPASSTGSAMGAMKPTSSTGYQPTQPNYYTSVPANFGSSANPMSPSSTNTSVSTQGALGGQQPKKTGSDAFGNIWQSASSGVKKTSTPTGSTPSLQAMAKEKATAGIWGAPASSASPKPNAFGGSTTAGKTGGDLDDLLG